jgi:predicted CopG family antitoxin
MKTIALREKTFELLKQMKLAEEAASFDELVIELLLQKEGVEESMFGALKGKTKKFSSKERKKIWGDKNR